MRPDKSPGPNQAAGKDEYQCQRRQTHECEPRPPANGVFEVPTIRLLLSELNPAQHRLLERHIERAIETLEEADRLLKGAVASEVAACIREIRAVTSKVQKQEAPTVAFALGQVPEHVVPYLEDPFAQGLAFNLFCDRKGLSHTRGGKQWTGGTVAVSARNLPFLPPIFHDLWHEGLVEKTRLVAIGNRNLTPDGYEEVADWIRERRKEDLDQLLLKIPVQYLATGRRGPTQALDAAKEHGWMERFATVDVPEDLVREAEAHHEEDGDDYEITPAEAAMQDLRAGVGGVPVDEAVMEVLEQSPQPSALVEKFLTGHRASNDAEPSSISKTLFFAHAGPMQRLVADDKLLLRHFRQVKTQKRGQLFYNLLEVLEEAILERQHLANPDERCVREEQGAESVREAIHTLNKDPNRHLVIPEEWLGEVTRRHLYFGSRTRKEGAAYKWFRKLPGGYFLGSFKTEEERAEKEARKAAKAAAAADAA